MLTTDACNTSVAGVLSHRFPDGQLKPVAFVTRTLSKSEFNYPIIEKDALAIIEVETNLLSNSFTISTDHKPLLMIFIIDKEADSFSRISQVSYIYECNSANYINMIVKDNQLRINFQNIAVVTRRAPILGKLLISIENGTVDKLDSSFSPFKNKSFELSSMDALCGAFERMFRQNFDNIFSTNYMHHIWELSKLNLWQDHMYGGQKLIQKLRI